MRPTVAAFGTATTRAICVFLAKIVTIVIALGHSLLWQCAAGLVSRSPAVGVIGWPRDETWVVRVAQTFVHLLGAGL